MCINVKQLKKVDYDNNKSIGLKGYRKMAMMNF